MSNILLAKSDENFKVGELVITKPNECFASSIHCFYYSLFQLIKYVSFNKFGLTEGKIIELRKAGSEKFQKSEHAVVFHYFWSRIKDSERFLSMELETTFGQLKSMRADADYHEVEISPELSKGAKKETEKIIAKIKDKLKV